MRPSSLAATPQDYTTEIARVLTDRFQQYLRGPWKDAIGFSHSIALAKEQLDQASSETPTQEVLAPWVEPILSDVLHQFLTCLNTYEPVSQVNMAKQGTVFAHAVRAKLKPVVEFMLVEALVPNLK